MKGNREMFEAIEMHVERMMAKRSEMERRSNRLLIPHEKKIEKLLQQLRGSSPQPKNKADEKEELDAHQ
jgi:hypothetical protein